MQLKLASPLPLTATLLSLSLISGVLADPCKQGLSYCGSTLEKNHDLSPSDLRARIRASPNSFSKLPALGDPKNALFRCSDDQGGLVLREFCYSGCEQPPNGDSCVAE